MRGIPFLGGRTHTAYADDEDTVVDTIGNSFAPILSAEVPSKQPKNGLASGIRRN